MEDNIKFGIMIPTDVHRHPDGTIATPCKSQQEKIDFSTWLIGQNKMQGFHELSGKEKEDLISQFRNENK